jgi:hypothetical protein
MTTNPQIEAQIELKVWNPVVTRLRELVMYQIRDQVVDRILEQVDQADQAWKRVWEEINR